MTNRVGDLLRRRDVCVFQLRREGHRILTAHDGTEALDLIRREHPELVLLDAMMPGLTGFEVARHQRRGVGRLKLQHAVEVGLGLPRVPR